MYFEPDEFEELEAAQDLLIRRCEAWAGGQGVEVDRFVMSAALDFRHGSIDGRLGFWTAASVHEFLLEWMPRKLSVTADQVADAPESLRILLRYLRHTDLDDPAGDPLPVLEEAITLAAVEFGSAMSDERNFGLAEFWVMKALASGVDPADQVAMQRFILRVQTGEVEYDAGIVEHLAKRQDSTAQERALPVLPVVLPTRAELADQAEQSRIVQ